MAVRGRMFFSPFLSHLTKPSSTTLISTTSQEKQCLMPWCWLGFFGFSSVPEDDEQCCKWLCCLSGWSTASAPQPSSLVACPPWHCTMAHVPGLWAHLTCLTWEGRNLVHNPRLLPSWAVKHFVIASVFASWERFTRRPSLAFGFTCPFELRSRSESDSIGFLNLLIFSCSVLQLCLWAKQHFIKAFLLSLPLFFF